MKKLISKIGSYAFIGGIGLALLVGIIAAVSEVSQETTALITAIMVVLGLIVGYMNVTDEEVNSYIIAAIGMSVGSVALGNMGKLLVGGAMNAMGTMIVTAASIFGVFVAGAAFIPALKAIYKISKD